MSDISYENNHKDFVPSETIFLKDLLKDFCLYLHSCSFSSFSITAYKKDCLDFISYTEDMGIVPSSIGTDVFNRYKDFLTNVKEVKPSSLRRKLLAIRKFFSYLESRNILSVSQTEIILPLRDDSLPQDLKTESISNIVFSMIKKSSTLKELRDCAIFLLLGIEGLKSREIIHLNWSDLIVGDTTSTLKIRGSKERLIELSHVVKDTLLKYRRLLFERIQETSSNMFVCFKSRMQTSYETLSPDGIKFIIRSISEEYGVKLNAELLRHHAISYMLAEGKSVADIQFHLGLKRGGNISKHSPIGSSSSIEVGNK